MHFGFSVFLKHALSLTKLLESYLVKNSDKQGSAPLFSNHQEVKTFHLFVHRRLKPNLHV